MNKNLLIAVILLIIASIFTGCAENSSEDLMQAPKLPIAQKEVEALVKTMLPADAKMISPLGGKHLSPIQYVDVDADDEDEVVVLYTIADYDLPLRGMILDKVDDQWRSDDCIKGVGHDFDQVTFMDVTGDGAKEIIVGLGGALQKGLIVYNYNVNGSKEIFENTYSEIAVDDLDQDGKAEIVLIKSDRGEGIANAELYKYQEKEIRLVSTTKMTPFAYYENVKIGKASEDILGIFVDAGIGAHSGLTSLLIIKDGQLKDVFYNEETEFDDTTFRAYPAYSVDIDGDGIIETPLYREPIGYEQAAMVEIPWIITWYEWDGQEGLTYNSESYPNYELGCYFHFPERWNTNITIDRYTNVTVDRYEKTATDANEKHYWVSFSYVDKATSSKYLLFTLHVFDLDEWEKIQNQSEYIELARKLDRVYLVTINEVQSELEEISQMKLDIDEIKANFEFIQ